MIGWLVNRRPPTLAEAAPAWIDQNQFLPKVRLNYCHLCITWDRSRGGPSVLGRNSILEMDLFSPCLVVQN